MPDCVQRKSPKFNITLKYGEREEERKSRVSLRREK